MIRKESMMFEDGISTKYFISQTAVERPIA